MSKLDKPASLWRNGITMLGWFLGWALGLLGVVLLGLDLAHGHTSSYVGILIYLVMPMVLGGCAVLVGVGLVWAQRRARRGGREFRLPVIDLGDRRTQWRIFWWGLTGALLLSITLLAGYRAYHFTESVAFCGEVCHQVMQPEYTAFKQSPHAGSSCTECHIGPGAEWFVKAKISGMYQVYSVLCNKFSRPIETPVQNLRPAKETCLTCHWPSKLFEPVLRSWTHYASDETNTPWTIQMLVNVGGGNPAHGPIKGIHWHMEGVNTVEYIATDRQRLAIPWVRVTEQSGKVTVYQSEDQQAQLSAAAADKLPKRRMDCMDCHNRPSHQFRSPNELMDQALTSGRLDATLPALRAEGAKLLASAYPTQAAAQSAIETALRARYATDPRLDATIRELQNIYSSNFFPEMKVSWKAYPNHIGHKLSAGCFRCHDGKHVSESGQRITHDCQICHTILAQGPGKLATEYTVAGQEFRHPEDIGDAWKTERCDTCHTGSP